MQAFRTKRVRSRDDSMILGSFIGVFTLQGWLLTYSYRANKRQWSQPTSAKGKIVLISRKIPKDSCDNGLSQM